MQLEFCHNMLTYDWWPCSLWEYTEVSEILSAREIMISDDMTIMTQSHDIWQDVSRMSRVQVSCYNHIISHHLTLRLCCYTCNKSVLVFGRHPALQVLTGFISIFHGTVTVSVRNIFISSTFEGIEPTYNVGKIIREKKKTENKEFQVVSFCMLEKQQDIDIILLK